MVSRQRRWAAVLLGVVLSLPATALGQPQAPQVPQAAPPSQIVALVEELAGLFPRVDGDVIEVQGAEVTVSLGRRDGMNPGLELSLYRPGRELKHPRTGQVLGRTEEALGRLRLREVFENYSVGTTAPGSRVAAGDRARITAGRIVLTIVPFVDRVNRQLAEGAAHELFEALNRTGRFRATWGDQVATWLAGQGVTAEEFLRGARVAEAARQFKAEYLLGLHFRTVERKPYMEARLFAPGQPEALLSNAFFVPPSLRRTAERGFSTGGAEKAPQQIVRQRSLLQRLLSGESEPTTYSSAEGAIPLREVARFPFVIRAFDVAVQPSDGIARVVLTDGSKIYLYRLSEAKLEPEWTYPVPTFGTVISVQLADPDGDGTLEVVVNRHHFSSQHSFGMVGFILGLRNGKPASLADDIDSILVAVDDTGAGVRRTLWSQRYDREKFFTAGDVTRVELRGGKLVGTGPARVPAEFRATGVTMANINGKTGPRVVAFVDAFRRLRLAIDREELWRSSTGVGGGGLKLEVNLPSSTGVRSAFFFTEPNPVAVDLDGDGVDEIVVPQNVIQDGLLAVIYRGPAGYRLQSVNSGFEGQIVGLGAIPGERPTLVAAVVRTRNFLGTEGETQIIITTNTE
jgi:hypothetical protein